MPNAETSRRNLLKARACNPVNRRSSQETLLIKLLIWQAYFLDGNPPTQHTLARQFGVHQSWVSRVYRQTRQAMDSLGKHGRVTHDDLRRVARVPKTIHSTAS